MFLIIVAQAIQFMWLYEIRMSKYIMPSDKNEIGFVQSLSESRADFIRAEISRSQQHIELLTNHLQKLSKHAANS